MKALVGAAGAVALGVFFIIAPLLRPDVKAPTLASKINAACTRPGFQVETWGVGDEFHQIAPGTVEVVCRNPKTFASYTVAVER